MLAAGFAITVVLALIVSGPSTRPVVPGELEGWPVVTVRIGAAELTVVEAVDTSRGLVGVDDLDPLDGMLFAYPELQDPAQRRFHMTGVRFALDALFFDADGRLIETVAMSVCTSDPCPRYAPDAPYRWVVEVPAGTLDAVPGDQLELLPSSSPGG